MALSSESRAVALAGLAVVGAGVIHLATAVAERDRGAVLVGLALFGALQVAWGAGFVGHSTKRSEAAGCLLAAISVTGWLVAVGTGAPVAVGIPDAIAAGLSGVVLIVFARRWVQGNPPATARRSPGWHGVAAVVAIAVSTVGAVAALPSTTDDRRSGPDAAQASGEEIVERATGGVPPYDPDLPLDLGGVVGVTGSQADAAEALVAKVRRASGAYPSAADAAAIGYRSMGDGFTGEEHFVHWGHVGDGVDLDPQRPEALVFDVNDDGTRTLVAAMFMGEPGAPLDAGPAPGGALTRWHLHGDLCLDASGRTAEVAGTTDASGSCPDGLVEPRPQPTLHVWLVAHPCGPFSELEGVGTGNTDPGCVHQHGS